MATYRRCWVIGAGAVVSVIAAALHKSDRIKTHLVGQSPHAVQVGKKGLVLDIDGQGSTSVDLNAVPAGDVPSLLGDDLVLLTGKVPALGETLSWLGPRCSPKTGIIALQNGLGPEEMISNALNRPVDRGLVFFGATSPSPGKGRYFPGAIRLRPSPVTTCLCRLLEGSIIQCDVTENFRDMAWFKLAINCVANPLAGILAASNPQIAEPVLDPAKESILDEVLKVALAEGATVDLTVHDINGYLIHENTPSMRTDIVRGKATEIEVINGAVVRLGQKHGIPTPANSLLTGMIRYLER